MPGSTQWQRSRRQLPAFVRKLLRHHHQPEEGRRWAGWVAEVILRVLPQPACGDNQLGLWTGKLGAHAN